MGLAKRIHDGYVLTEGEKIMSVGEYSEEPKTTAWFVKTYGMTPVEYAHSIGFLDTETILAHQVNCTENDLTIIKKTGAKVVHNPLANTILGSGMPPLKKMEEMGIPYVISTDGSGSADNQDILLAARSAAQYQKAFHGDA
jgi:5-methylthioadenosine/S-adenosylhomocysteine deaminase